MNNFLKDELIAVVQACLRPEALVLDAILLYHFGGISGIMGLATGIFVANYRIARRKLKNT